MIALILAISAAVLPGEAAFTQANSHAQATRYADALAAYQEVVAIDPALAPYAKIRAATVRAQAGDPAGAIQALNTLMATDPTAPWRRGAEYALATLLHNEKRYEEAAPHYARAIESEVNLWWMDEIRWEVAANQLEIPEQRIQGLNFFRTLMETTGWYSRRLNAARILKESDRADDRIQAALALLRSRKYDEAKTVAASIPKTWLSEAHLTRQWEHLSARILIARGMRTEGQQKLKALAEAYPEDTWADTALLYAVISLISAEQMSDAEALNAQLMKRYPTSQKTGDSLLRLARAHAKLEHTQQSIDWYRTYMKQFPDSTRTASILLEAAHVYRNAQRDQEAIGLYDQLMNNHPRSTDLPEAAYWAGRLLEKNGQHDSAQQHYALAVKNGLTHYYGHRAQDVLVTRYALATPTVPTLNITPNASFVRAIPQASPDPGFALNDLMKDDPQFSLLRYFAHHGYPEAEWESLHLSQSIQTHATPETLYRGLGESGVAYSAMQWASNKGFGVGNDGAISVERWRIRYPRPYWEYVSALAQELDLDPYLILAIARQESTYRPALQSHAGATGVMQLMPRTAEWLAQVDGRVSQTNATHLDQPQHSLRMGTVYFKRMLDRSDGNIIYALASYNAGPGNCDKWRKRHPDYTTDQFVENIPFPETQNYVKRILAHYATYKSLYPE